MQHFLVRECVCVLCRCHLLFASSGIVLAGECRLRMPALLLACLRGVVTSGLLMLVG